MATARNNDAEDFVKCGVCFCEFDAVERKPKFLSCAHIICLICLQKIDFGDVITCPFCHRKTLRPKDNVDSLPNNSYSLHILKQRDGKEELPRADKLQIKPPIGIKWCLTCETTETLRCSSSDHSSVNIEAVTIQSLESLLKLKEELLKIKNKKICQLTMAIQKRMEIQKCLSTISKSIQIASDKVKTFQDENNFLLSELISLMDDGASSTDIKKDLVLSELVDDSCQGDTAEILKMKMEKTVVDWNNKLTEATTLASDYQDRFKTRIAIQLYDENDEPIQIDSGLVNNGFRLEPLGPPYLVSREIRQNMELVTYGVFELLKSMNITLNKNKPKQSIQTLTADNFPTDPRLPIQVLSSCSNSLRTDAFVPGKSIFILRLFKSGIFESKIHILPTPNWNLFWSFCYNKPPSEFGFINKAVSGAFVSFKMLDDFLEPAVLLAISQYPSLNRYQVADKINDVGIFLKTEGSDITGWNLLFPLEDFRNRKFRSAVSLLPDALLFGRVVHHETIEPITKLSYANKKLGKWKVAKMLAGKVSIQWSSNVQNFLYLSDLKNSGRCDERAGCQLASLGPFDGNHGDVVLYNRPIDQSFIIFKTEMELNSLNIQGLSLLMQKVYLPLMEYLARKANNKDWIDTLKDFEVLMTHFVILVDDDPSKIGNPMIKNPAAKPHPTSFASLREESLYWQKQIIELSTQQQWMLQNWGEATIETTASLRQAHYTLKLFRLVRDPIEIFTERKTIARVDLYVKSLAASLKAVVLQPSGKSGVHSKFADLIGSNTNTLARWMLQYLKPKELLKPEVDVVIQALRLWESQWAESKLSLVSRLTIQEFSDMFLGTRTVLDNIETVQGLIRETKALREMSEQIDDYFARQRLIALIRDDLERRVESLDMKLFLVDNRLEFQEFLQTHQAAQKTTVDEIKSTLKQVLDNHTSFEGLKLLRKVIDKSNSLAGTHSGALDQFLAQYQRDQLNRLSTEIRLIRKGFDVTDYLNEKEVGNVDMARRLFERRLLYHRVKVSLLTIFPNPSDWDETAASIKIKDQYTELAKYLKTTEDKLHHKWFTTVQKRANRAMSRPILKKTPKGFVTTLQDTLMTIWDETRLFLQTRFQVPHVCHILLMQKPDLIHHNRAIIAVLERLSSVVEKLTPFEFIVLNSCYSSVENGLNLGTSHVTWPSLCLSSYIQELMESVERFQAMAEDVALISNLLEKRISQIMDHQLLSQQENDVDPDLSAAQFFEKLSQSGEDFFLDIRRIVSELPPILLQVESIVCNSQTGSAPELQNYYDYWREKIYVAVLKSVQARFDELSNLLENGPAQFVIELSLRNGRVVVEPDLDSIERDISGIVHHWIKKSSVVPEWQEGSCNALPVDQRSFYDRLSREPLLKVTVDRDQQHCKRLVCKLRTIIDRWTDCTELWCLDKVDVCEQLRRTSPSLSQYDEQLRYYKNYWSDRIGAIEAQVVTSCVTLQMKQLKKSALDHIKEWIRQLGATWLAGTKEKLTKVEELVKIRHKQSDGSTDIDIEMLLTEVQESWHRLRHYHIKVPEELRSKLKAIQQSTKLK